jgi:hypothetical protein
MLGAQEDADHAFGGGGGPFDVGVGAIGAEVAAGEAQRCSTVTESSIAMIEPSLRRAAAQPARCAPAPSWTLNLRQR